MKIDIGTRNFEADAKVRAYAETKISALEKYVPRKHRRSLMAQVLLEEDPNGREDNRYVTEVLLSLPGSKLVSREATLNMYAAIDIVEAKLKAQVRTYKDKYFARPRRVKLITRWLNRLGSVQEGVSESSA